ncbi:hypothetical protein L249_6490 [Ophiocordyceps polyrhachis-furcata BCC 54312]|uniref:LysM domain-containing protein n=1 Tax=Ophiocordyceps polyrhachis-furcata BCC 54312 TaxID=1330021 RepID=A0A367LK56_9HYPO|nr:hypothetical protein L249_6490 [Ophiocordyceps polyrhachis-furcata BCC 54312]
MDSCCTCATLLPVSSSTGVKTLSLLTPHFQSNRRFATYCPYCQVSTSPSPLPQGLRDPPAYTSVPSTRTTTTAAAIPPPPPYSPCPTATAIGDQKAVPEKTGSDDILHFLDHDHDTITALSLRYQVPAPVLRQTNNITSDHLLLGRKTILIPGEYYKTGVSLSPCPVLGEEEELRKSKIRRFMTCCKVADYDVALLYLEQAEYHLRAAIDSYLDDESWGRHHPQPGLGNRPRAGKREKGCRPQSRVLEGCLHFHNSYFKCTIDYPLPLSRYGTRRKIASASVLYIGTKLEHEDRNWRVG